MLTPQRFSLGIAIGLVGVGTVLLLAPAAWFPSFYAVRFMGIMAWVFALVLFLFPLVFKSHSLHEKKAVEHLQAALALCFLLSGLGELGLWQLYRWGFEYDKAVHAAVPLILTIAMVDFLKHWVGFSTSHARTYAAMLVLGGALIWEGLEFGSDYLFGTQLFGVYGQQLTGDTIIDIVWDVLGVLVGSFLARKRTEV